MEGETYNLALVWSMALASLLYSYLVGKFLAQGTSRFLAFFPVLLLFLYLPLSLNSMILCGITSFFIAWLATFKITLFAFGLGPLASNPPLPFSQFILVACLPIKILKTSSKNQENPETTLKSAKHYVPKVFIFFITIKALAYKDYLHPLLVNSIYALIVCFSLDLCLTLSAFMVRNLVGIKLESHFNEPMMATSVQDFFGKRWNLVVANILRSMVYLPTRRMFSHIIPQKWVSVPAVFVTFLVSGIMHEVIFYHLGRLHPTWEVMSAFIIHGVWVGVEIVIKKTIGHRFKLPSIIARVLTIWFVTSTAFWLLFPPFLRFNPFSRACREVIAFVEFIKHGRMISSGEFVCPYYLKESE